MKRIQDCTWRATLLLFIIPLLVSCATVYAAPDFSDYSAKHKKVALLPFDVSINPEHKSREVTAKDLAKLETEQSRIFQRAMYSQYLKGYQRDRYTISFQDIEETNTLLNRKAAGNNPAEAIKKFTKAELCEILDVDAVVSGDMVLTKPMGSVAAIAVSFLIGLGVGTTNEAHINMSIHEGDAGKLLWNFDHSISGGLDSSPENVAKRLIRDAAGSFPYRRDKS